MSKSSLSMDYGLAPLSKLPAVRGRRRAEAVGRIKDWFFENFEDPSEGTSYNGPEGGYQYLHGGPYDTRDVVEENFGDLISQGTIDLAIEEIEEDGISDWSPARHRVLPEDDPDEDFALSIAVLHRRMLRKLDEVESAFKDIDLPPAGLGHNNPPESIGNLVLDSEELTELRKAVALLKDQPAEPNEMLEVAVQAAATLSKIGKKIADYCAKHADSFITEAAKSAGTEFGKWTVRGPALLAAAAAASEWLARF